MILFIFFYKHNTNHGCKENLINQAIGYIKLGPAFKEISESRTEEEEIADLNLFPHVRHPRLTVEYAAESVKS